LVDENLPIDLRVMTQTVVIDPKFAPNLSHNLTTHLYTLHHIDLYLQHEKFTSHQEYHGEMMAMTVMAWME
jgi:hypothetical protein